MRRRDSPCYHFAGHMGGQRPVRCLPTAWFACCLDVVSCATATNSAPAFHASSLDQMVYTSAQHTKRLPRFTRFCAWPHCFVRRIFIGIARSPCLYLPCSRGASAVPLRATTLPRASPLPLLPLSSCLLRDAERRRQSLVWWLYHWQAGLEKLRECGQISLVS